MKTTLVLIDLQNDYFPGGRMELEGPLDAVARARSLLDLFRQRGWPTVHIQHISTRPGATFFLPGTEGIDFHPTIAPLPGETVIVKHFPNSFRETGLLETLHGWEAEQLLICGMMTHMCVDASVRAAADFGFQVILAADACATRALSFGGISVPAEQVHAAFLAALQSYGQVMSTEDVLSFLGAENEKEKQ